MSWKQNKKDSNSDLDFDEFKNQISWFIKPNDSISFEKKFNNPILSDVLNETFPKLCELISLSRILQLSINGKSYYLYSWTNKENISCGWLTEIEQKRNIGLKMCLAHELLLEEIGGIRESYNQPKNSLCNNQNFMFIGSECSKGIGLYDEYYEMMCKDKECKKLSDKDLISFVQEANGSLTLYDFKTEKVRFFSHDHALANVVFLENQPEYTFHKFKGIDTFSDYVESLAIEWLNEMKK